MPDAEPASLVRGKLLEALQAPYIDRNWTRHEQCPSSKQPVSPYPALLLTRFHSLWLRFAVRQLQAADSSDSVYRVHGIA